MRPRSWQAAWSGGVEQVGLWWPHGAHVPGHLSRFGPQDPPPAETSSPTSALPPALIGSLAIWKHEHRGLFRSPVLQYSLHPHWREREAGSYGKEKQECENSLNLILNDSWNISPKCPHLHSGTLSAFVRGCTMLNDVVSVQCNNWLASWKSGLDESMFIGRNAATGDGRASLYCIFQLLVTPGFIGPLFLFFLTKGDFFFNFLIRNQWF